MRHSDKLSEIFRMDDEELEKFWEQNDPEDFEGWEKGMLRFIRPHKKSVQPELDPRDIRQIDKDLN
ncbi:hypothetical protein QUF80_23390 [Desulfococcaceae bacterium HSG8]|nr:hypothetical protein [Desulfococcaceae bacterium HSG8]